MSLSKFIDNEALALLSLVSKMSDAHAIGFTTKVLSEIAYAQADCPLYGESPTYDEKKSGENITNTPKGENDTIGLREGKQSDMKGQESAATEEGSSSDSDSDEDVIIFKGRAYFAASKPTDTIKEKLSNAIDTPQPVHTTSSEIKKEAARKWRSQLTLLELAKCLAEGDTTLVVNPILGKCGMCINEFTPTWILESRPATKEESTKDRNLWVHKVFADKEINDWVLLLDNFRKERKKRLGDAVNDEERLLEEWNTVRGGLEKVQNLENELTRVADEISLQQAKGC